jgi:glyoxylase-like metal-dependent hydrolase (beta-lactamase superfamily II)
MPMIRTLPIHPIVLPTPFVAAGPVHAYLIRQDPITLVDAGLNDPGSRAALLHGLSEVGIVPSDIRRVLLTHAHMDHFGQAAFVQAESGAEVWLHPDEAGKLAMPAWWLAGRDAALAEAGVPLHVSEMTGRIFHLGRQLVLPLEEWLPLRDGQRFAFEDGALEAVHLPGHALGHTGFWDRETGVLIGGDHLLEGITPNPIMEPVEPGHPAAPAHAPGHALTLGLFLGALERVAGMEVSRVLPGHGAQIEQHAAVAQRYQATHERRLGSLREKIVGGSTVYEMTQRLYPRVREFNIFLAISEVLAHLDLLVDRGQAVIQMQNGVNRYRA